MPDTVTLDDLQNRIKYLQSSIEEEISQGFESVASSKEGKLLLVQIYAERLAPLLVKVQRSLDTDLDLDTLQAYLADLDLFIIELRAAIQSPHRIKIENDLAHWLLTWLPNEKVDWSVFLLECTEADLVELDEAISKLRKIQILDTEVRGMLSKWIALQIVDLTKFAKNVTSLLGWLETIGENLDEGLLIDKELADIESKVNGQDWNSVYFLSSAWLRDMKKQHFDSDPTRDWSANTTKENLTTAWGEIQNRLTTIRPMLANLDGSELDLIRHDFQYSITTQRLDILIEDLRKLVIHKPNLNKPQLRDNGKKLTLPGYKRISDFLDNLPTKKITIGKQTVFDELVNNYEKAAREIPEWLENFTKAKDFLLRMAKNWKIIREEQISPVPDDEILKAVNLTSKIQSLGDLIEAHNALSVVEKRIKQELRGTLSSLEADLFDQLTRLAAADDKFITLRSLKEEKDQTLISLARKGLVDVFIRV